MQASGEAIEAAYRVFGELIERNLIACTTMINGYIPCCDLVTARRLFDLAPERDIVLWNTMISGFIEAGDIGRAESWLQGKCYVGNALMDMYAKCGVVETAFDVFKSMDKKDLISWNTIIGGLALHGHGADAFNFFSQTKSAGGNLDLITFIGILACRVYKTIEFAELALGKLIEFEPKNLAIFVMLSNLHWDLGRWKDFKSNQETYGTASFQGNYVLWYSQEYLCGGDAYAQDFCPAKILLPLVSETNDGSYSVSLVSMLPAVVEIITGCGTLLKLLPSAR
ncbi:hypothetical protein Peur_018124 [Populus x canadensis]